LTADLNPAARSALCCGAGGAFRKPLEERENPMTLRRIGPAVLALTAGLALASCDNLSDAEPSQLWELSGFEAPESALPVKAENLIYVSNVNGNPTEKDGNGYISQVSLDGKMISQKWVTGLDAPKGLAIAGGKLYAADIDKLVEIDTKTGAILTRYEAKDAKFLNDVAADANGNVYVSDMVTNTIWRLADRKFEVWLNDAALINPNGLLIEGDKLIVAAWGVMTDGFTTKIPGHLLEISLADKSIKALGNGKPVGNLDGLEPFGKDSYLVTDWMAGLLFKVGRDGEAKVLMPLSPGSADLGFVAADKLAIIPLMKDGKLIALKVE
jgi:hypothetical protein